MIELDNRIKTSINNSVILHKRCTFILTGSKATENVPIIFSIRNYNIDYNAKILWCFKRDNSFIKRGGKNHRKFEKSCKKMNFENDEFENFAFSYDINWCHYNDTDTILGTTYDACVLQDFDSLTPNKIAKVIETVRGGGLVVILLPNVSKISDFGALEMDAHKKYKTFAYDKIDFRFNYRFFYSIMNYQDCFVLDSNLQVLPVNLNLIKSIAPLDDSNAGKRDRKLIKLKKKLTSCHENLKNLIEMCATKDQCQAFINLSESIKTSYESKSSFEITKKKSKICNQPFIAMISSGRGRGKSALLGMAIATAVHTGLSTIYVTSPSLDNVGTLMQFVVNGLTQLGYQENRDFIKRVKSMEGSKTHGIVEIEIVKNSQRQIVRYILPGQSEHLEKVDLLCIDETAAIPLPIVRKLMAVKCQLVFMSSTIHGYEGTGRSLSLKLMKQIREGFQSDNSQNRFLEISLKEPIRYSKEDKVEKWLNDLLCLDCGNDEADSNNTINNYQPSLNDCQLFFINRDALFSGSITSELFLQQIMGIYVSSHYKNTPNDLQMLADCSSHAMFCLAKPVLMGDGLPIICAVIQVSFEGSIDPVVAKSNLEKGIRPSGDMVAWTVVQQFNQYEFVKLSGARIVRIAVHPSFQRQGYGGHALKLLYEYFDQEKISAKTPVTKTIDELVKENEKLNNLSNVTELPPVNKLGNLLIKLSDITPTPLDYIGVSFGLTSDLLRFWKKNFFIPVYLRQTMNDATGEHSCLMIRQMSRSDHINGESEWLQEYSNDFCRRFCNLLPGPFKKIDSIMALELIHQKFKPNSCFKIDATANDLNAFFTNNDFIRIDKYLKNMIDYHGIMDLVHGIAVITHTKRIPNLKLPKFQDLVLVGLGLQYKTVDELAEDLKALQSVGLKVTTASEILGHLRECLKNISKAFKSLK